MLSFNHPHETVSIKQTTLIYLTAISAGILLISNLAATKLWNMFGIAVDGGILCFPISYILGDIIIEFYGKKIAKSVILSSLLLNIFAALVFWAVCLLPPFTGTEEMQASIVSVLGFAPRIILGSLTAYLFSQFSNNYIFEKIKKKTGSKFFLVRALGSSVVAHFLDSLIFETIAFFGVLAFNDFLNQALFAYLLGLGLELILSPIELFIVSKVRPYLKEEQNASATKLVAKS
ncbi:MAG: queuosine precursor transporter [Candidatus Nanosyncoccus sp.]